MCSYNGVRFLDNQLASLAIQTRQPDEVVVCDDCSTDTSLTVLQRFGASVPFPVKIYTNKTRLGSSNNFEQAITLCQGDVIALCDQDDIWLPNKLELMERCFSANPDVIMVFSDAEIVDEEARPLGYRLWEVLRFNKKCQARIKTKDAFDLLNRRTLVSGATMAFRATFKDLVLPIPLNIPLIHDGWIALILSLAGKIDLIDRPLIKYRQHGTQQIGARTDEPVPPYALLTKFRRQYSFDSEIRKLEAVRDRVHTSEDRYEFNHEVNLDLRLNHLNTRLAVSQQKIGRVPTVLGELFTGRYHRYSNGFYSLIKDLVQ